MIKDWNRDYTNLGMFAQRMYPNEALLQFVGGRGLLNGSKRWKILEVGCGSGANIWMLAKEGHDVYGIDTSDEGIRVATEHLRNKWGVEAELMNGSFTNIPFEDGFFDLVIDIVSLQHIDLDTTSIAFKEISRVLKPGGLFFSYRLSDRSVQFYNGKSGENKIDALTIGNISSKELPLNNCGTVSFWSPGVVHIKYREAGLNVLEIERNSRTYENGKYLVEYLSIVGEK